MTKTPLNSNYFRVDNAANLYATNTNKDWCRTYRSGVVLDEDVKPEIMQQALEDTIKRFPSFQVKLKNGVFWNYFEKTDDVPKVTKDVYMPYRPIQLEGTSEPPFRVTYYKNRLTMETFHSVSDGAGNSIFFFSMLARYYELQGEEIPKVGMLKDLTEAPKESEVRDEYIHYSDSDAPAQVLSASDSYLNENVAEKDFALLINGLCKVDEIKAVSKSHGLTINEYLVANLIYMFIMCEEKPIYKDVSISVPINLRARFESENVRNFTSMEGVSFNPHGRKDVSFEEICESIKGQFASKTSNEQLIAGISSNVAAQKKITNRIVPYPIKRIFMHRTYKKSQQSFSTFLSNVGISQHTPELNKHILRNESALGSTPYSHFGCTAVSNHGLMNFTFCSGNHDVEKQKFFFRHIASEGVHIRIESSIHE